MYIILERLRYDEIDEFLLEKVTLIDNSTEDKRSWQEALKDELLLQFSADQRAVIIEEYVNMGMLGKIFEQYRQLNDKLKSFNFLSDDLDSHAFFQIQNSSQELDKLTNEFELDN